MASWLTTLQGAHPAYGWASPLDSGAWQAFVDAVAAYLEPRNRPVQVQPDGVFTARADGPQVNLGLDRLAARCVRAPRRAWSFLAAEHLAGMLAPPDLPAGFPYHDFERAKLRVKMRLTTPTELDARGDLPVIRLDPAPGLAAVLCYDLPDGPCDVPPTDSDAWGHPEATLYAHGFSNLRHMADLKPAAKNLPSGAVMQLLRGDSPFVSAQILVLERLLGGPAPYGALACVPERSMLIYHHIVDARVAQAAEEIGKLAAMLCQRAASPLSPHLYWFRKGALSHLPMEVTTQGVTFKPPAGFTARVLKPLGA